MFAFRVDNGRRNCRRLRRLSRSQGRAVRPVGCSDSDSGRRLFWIARRPFARLCRHERKNLWDYTRTASSKPSTVFPDTVAPLTWRPDCAGRHAFLLIPAPRSRNGLPGNVLLAFGVSAEERGLKPRLHFWEPT